MVLKEEGTHPMVRFRRWPLVLAGVIAGAMLLVAACSRRCARVP